MRIQKALPAAAILVMVAFAPATATAQVEYHGPDQQIVPYTDCLSMLDGSVWCDGAGYVNPPKCAGTAFPQPGRVRPTA